MQPARLLPGLVLCAAASPPGVPPALAYGPNRCVSIGRAPATGTCVLKTKCAEHDIASFDFSFDCLAAVQGRTTHSLGIGSFDTEEDYDTGVVCDACVPPKGGPVVVPATTLPLVSAVARSAEHKVVAKTGRAAVVHQTVRAVKSSKGTVLLQHAHHKKKGSKIRDPNEKEWSKNNEVERYGPSGCVSTWKDESNNHCMMQTDCDDALAPDLAVYEFGLLCRQEDGDTVRHIFGQNSFDKRETFDTLIECQECLALDEYMDSDAAVKLLAQEVSTLREAMSGVTADLNKLNQAVLSTPAPAPAPAAAEAANLMAQKASGTASGSGQQQNGHHRGALRGGARKGALKAASKVVAKAAAKASTHRGGVKKQQKRVVRRSDTHKRASRSEDGDENGVEADEVVADVDGVRRSQRKSKAAARKVAQRRVRETDQVDEDDGSDEQDQVQDGDESDSQEDEDDAQEDIRSGDGEGNDEDSEEHDADLQETDSSESDA